MSSSSTESSSTSGASGLSAVPFPKLWLNKTPSWFHGGYGRGWVKGETSLTSVGSFGARRLGWAGDTRAVTGGLFRAGLYQLGAEGLHDAMLINSDSDVLNRLNFNQSNNPYSNFVFEGNHFFSTNNKQNLIQQEALKAKQDSLRRMNPALYDMGTSAGY